MQNTKRFLLIIAILAAIAIVVLAACGGIPTPAPATEAPPPTAAPTAVPAVPEGPVVEVPYEALWAGSAHNAVDTEPFRHWDGDSPAEVPTSCAKCHSTAGYRDYLGADGSEALKVDAAVPAADAQGIQCVACHNPVTTFQLTNVQFPCN